MGAPLFARIGTKGITPHDQQGLMRLPRLLAALCLLALPLAGCTAPEASQPAALAAAAGPAHPSSLVPRASPAGALDAEDALPCPAGEQRREERRLHEVILTVEGCLAAAEPIYFAWDVAELDFEVPPGARSVLVLHRLQGEELLRGKLLWPDGTDDGRHHDGTAGHPTLLRWEYAAPEPGTYRLRSWMEELTVARAWSITIVIAY